MENLSEHQVTVPSPTPFASDQQVCPEESEPVKSSDVLAENSARSSVSLNPHGCHEEVGRVENLSVQKAVALEESSISSDPHSCHDDVGRVGRLRKSLVRNLSGHQSHVPGASGDAIHANGSSMEVGRVQNLRKAFVTRSHARCGRVKQLTKVFAARDDVHGLPAGGGRVKRLGKAFDTNMDPSGTHEAGGRVKRLDNVLLKRFSRKS